MSDLNVCPSCGAKLEANVGSKCPFCGSDLPVSAGSAPTLISRPISKNAEFENSAEAMDEIKQRVSDGDTAGATLIASSAFDLPEEAARTTVEQIKTDMPISSSSSDKTMLSSAGALAAAVAAAEAAQSATASQAYIPPASAPVNIPAQVSAPAPVNNSFGPAGAINTSGEPPKQSNRQRWIIGGSIAAVVLVCCCCLPLVFAIYRMLAKQ
jgi:cobalamin biosynthesis Mg chelatase CobN